MFFYIFSILILLFGIFSFQIGSSFAKSIFPLIGPEAITFFRQTLSTFILCLMYRPWKIELKKAHLRFLFLYGVSLGVMNLFFYLSIERIPIGICATLQFTGPLTLAIAFSKKAVDFFWAFLAIIGILLLFPLTKPTPHFDGLGIIYAFLAAIGWGFYIVFGKKVANNLPLGQAIALGHVIATLVTYPITLPMAISMIGAKKISFSIFFTTLCIGLFASVIPYSLEMIALKKLPTKTFSILMSLEPVIACISGFFILGEKLMLTHIFALFFIIIASLGTTCSLSYEKRNPKGIA